MSDAEVTALAVKQGGFVTRNQLEALGFTPRMRDYRLATGRWHRVSGLGYQVLSMEDPVDRLRGAVALLPGAVSSHQAAASLQKFPGFPQVEPAVTVHTRTTHNFPGVRVHRSHDLVASHWSVRDGLPVTTPERTVIDLAASTRVGRMTDLVQDLIISRSIALGTLEELVAEVCRRGKPGSAVMREVLHRLSVEPVGQSMLERRGRELLAFGMFPEPVHEYPIPWSPNRRFDDAYPDAQLAIEWDSRSWHGRLDQIDDDRQRDRECLVHGWRLLRFTWTDVTTRQNDVITAVASMLTSDVAG
jgi:hypothetical protein